MPKALYLLVTPIEFLSTFLIRPFSLAVRLFANMLAGHILLVTFSVLCITLWSASVLAGVLVLSFPMLVAFTGFEFMVAFLQAYIFTLLTAVYIGGALHPPTDRQRRSANDADPYNKSAVAGIPRWRTT